MSNQIDFSLSLDDLKVIDAALAEMPYRLAAPVVAKINQQLQEEPKHNLD